MMTTYLVWFFFTIQHVGTFSDLDSCLAAGKIIANSGSATSIMCLTTEYPHVSE